MVKTEWAVFAVAICILSVVAGLPISAKRYYIPTDQESCQSTYSYNYTQNPKSLIYTECRNVFRQPGQELSINIQPNSTNHIVFKNSVIPIISKGAFTSFTSLTELYLNGNGVKNCVFNGILNLRVLHLQDNYIMRISNETFASLINLQVLDLSKNSIISLEQGCFKELVNLKFIGLNRNRLYIVDPKMFVSQIVLETLDLSQNYLYMSEFNFTLYLNSQYLEKLLVNNNRLRHFAVNSLKMLNNFNLFDVSFNVLPKVALTSTVSPKFANFSNNQITNITAWVNLLQSRDIPNMYSDGQGLENFNNFYSEIIYLDLSYNFIKKLVNNSFQGFGNLEVLLLNNNKIFHLSKGCFVNLESLRLLSLSQNCIEHLEFEIFYGLSMLTTLQLDNNKLSTITTKTFSSLKNLKNLYLSQNLLYSISERAFLRPLPNLNTIYLNDIDWNCGEFVDITGVLKNYSIQLPEDKNSDTVNVFKITCNHLNVTVITSNMERKSTIASVYTKIFLLFAFSTVFIQVIVVVARQYHQDLVIKQRSQFKIKRISVTRLEAIPVK